MQEKYARLNSIDINLWELLNPSPSNKFILESTWVTKGPFKDLNWNIVLFKQTSKQTENCKMYTYYSSQNGKISASTSTKNYQFPFFPSNPYFGKQNYLPEWGKECWNSLLIPALIFTYPTNYYYIEQASKPSCLFYLQYTV